jgi:hypothetical protein
MYNNQGIVINQDNKEYIQIPCKIALQNKDEKPAYCIDSLKHQIFICIPYFGIKCFNLSNKTLIKEQILENKYFRKNYSYNLRIINNYIVFSSYLQVCILNKNLEFVADIRDTIDTYKPHELALHKFNVEFSKDTLLFKAMFVDRSDFLRNKRYKRIFKDYEFILGGGKIKCNNP